MAAELEKPQKNASSSSSSPVAASPASAKSTKPKSPLERTMPAHDSLVTVRLSEPPPLSVNTDLPPIATPTRKSIFGPQYTPTSATTPSIREEEEAGMREETGELKTAVEPVRSLQEELESMSENGSRTKSLQESDESADESDEEVNWEQLQKTEDEQVKEQDDNSTAMLLARLEQENNKIATNPKSIKVKVVEQPALRRPRPPSMAQLRDMVSAPTPVALRYSTVPPPPMTDLQFYMALVKDYQQTAARLPTLLSHKIRKGIPPPLRGVVWQSMAGARDSLLLEQFDKLSGESSPYEGLIGKDLGRSFPGVDMFRDPEGDGQRMLGRVLKCFSLYDHKIGYCQGLAFLVGPLLMHMPDSQAFCVLVRLMERYDLRSCFLPDLSGLHVRIYQFRELLRQNMSGLSNHLDDLQVDPAYVSQWFLSFFAVTCPLPMLFRIYDVIFAEGASETIMRVALSLMRKNESRILACTEMEDVMQLLLSRGLWDGYHYNADEFVDDFLSLSSVVSREKLAQLEQGYREEKIAASAARTADVTTAASRFLGRLWTASSSSPKSASLSPGLTAPLRPLSMLRRSASKQSLASTLNSMEASSSSVLSTSSTDATTISRDSSTADDSSFRESTPIAPKHYASHNAADKNLHSQIEDLLTALSELQRNHSLLATQLQKEREERDEDRKAVKCLLDGLKKKNKQETDNRLAPTAAVNDGESLGDGDKSDATDTSDEDRLSQLMSAVADRLGTHHQGRDRSESSLQTKPQLREELARTKENLRIEMSRSQELNRRIHDLDQEANTLKEQLRESHTHVRNIHQDKQRLERQVHSMRVRASAESPGSTLEPSGWFSSSNASSSNTPNATNGLREFKLGRSKSTPNTQSFVNRSGSLARTQTEPIPSAENDALVVELVQAKTAEAVARQEADEYKQKLESLRKTHGLAPGDYGQGNGSATGVIGRLTTSISDTNGGAKSPAASTATPSTSTGGFWGWRR